MSKVRANNKGFTLIELLASISILAIIMLMAIPNIVGIVQRNKNKVYIEDAKKVITLAKYEIKKDVSKKPTDSSMTKTIYLKDLDKSKEVYDAPNGGHYEREGSYVTIQYVSGMLKYYITLYEIKNESQIGLFNVSEDDLYKSNAVELVKTKGKTTTNGGGYSSGDETSTKPSGDSYNTNTNTNDNKPYGTTSSGSYGTVTYSDAVPALSVITSTVKVTSINPKTSYSGNIVIRAYGKFNTNQIDSMINSNTNSISIGGIYGGVSVGNYSYYSASVGNVTYGSDGYTEIPIYFSISSSNPRLGSVQIKVPAGAVCGANNKCNTVSTFFTGVTVKDSSSSYSSYY